MSSGQLPRTPKHFPKMKYRARKRQHRNHVHWCLPQDRQSAVHVSIVPVTHRFFDSQIKRAVEALRRIALDLPLTDLDPAADNTAPPLKHAKTPTLPRGASADRFLLDEAFNEFALPSLPVDRPIRRTIVLNPNVRKQR